MESQHLFITYVETEGPFLKIWGQPDKQTSLYVEQVLQSLTNQLDNNASCIPSLESLRLGGIYCAKYNDNKYYRARITKFHLQKYIEVNFIDYGNQDIVPVTSIRTLQTLGDSLRQVPPQANAFLLAEVVCLGAEGTSQILDEICNEIRYTEVNFTLVAQLAGRLFARLFIVSKDLASLLVSKGIMRHVSVKDQEAIIMSTVQRTAPPPAAQVQPALAGFKAFTLEPGLSYEVYVSYVTDGPTNFSVQLKQSEEVLGKLMKEINSIALAPLEGFPLPGSVCLARCLEDGNICRAVVTNEVDGQYKVFYVDFGNFEMVPIDVLYELPFKYVIPKVMAIRIALANVDKTTITFEMLCAFKQFVDNRLLHLKLLPMATRTGLPHCELWDPTTGVTALDILNQVACTAYPSNLLLSRGFSQGVKVTFVYSCSRFFVQLLSKQEELLRLMTELQEDCPKRGVLSAVGVKVGLPCCAFFNTDQQWYRVQITEIINSRQVKVQYVDFGNEETVDLVALKPIDGKLLTVLSPQAIECCLNGYQNMEADFERDSLLEELILEQSFNMRVIEMKDEKALIELIDSANYNVASLLLDKIAMHRSQVSPMLVQADNKIDHRKSRENSMRKLPADHNAKKWGKNSTDFWRQENKGSRSRNESYENNSFRQQNKSFNRSDRNPPNDGGRSFNRENERSFDSRSTDSNDTQSGKQNKGFSRNSRPNRENNRNNDSWGGGDNNDRLNKGYSPRGDSREKPNWTNGREGGRNFTGRDKENSFNKSHKTNGEVEKWNSNESNKFGESKRKNDRASSELSSDGSEKGGRKGRRDFNNKSDYAHKSDFKKPYAKQENDWNAEVKTVTKNTAVPNPAPESEQFKFIDLNRSDATVTISWFHNPSQFYCLVEDTQNDFRKMMDDIQEAYKSRAPSTLSEGAPIVGLFPEDNVLYRAQILQVLGNQFKVYFVDFGNISTISKIWPIEMRFMEMPAQAICCKLHDIEPIDGIWPPSTNYAKYFGKKRFNCKFLSSANGSASIQLEYNGEDIGQMMLKDGLAVIPAPIPTVEAPLLIGQQFRAMLLEVESLAKFTMCLQSGAVLTCTVFNLDVSTQTREENLKDKINQILIVYVDNVGDDDVIHLTPYNTDGTKIKLIDKDEEAFETVEIICPYLITQSILTGDISHAENATIFVQPADCTDLVNNLLNAMFEAYDAIILENPIEPVVGYNYAIKGLDGNWYRGKVVKMIGGYVEINYFDYGNSEIVDIGNLRELSLNFMEIQVLCVPVTLSSGKKTEDLIGAHATISLNFTELGLEGTIKEVAAHEKPPETTKTEEETTKAEEETSQVLEDEVFESPPPKSDQKTTAVIVSHIDSPSDFYLQLVESLASIDQVQAELNSAEMEPLESATVGVLCAAPYSIDQLLYRAQVLDADADITTVRFVDFGNTDVIDNKLTQVKTLPPSLLSIEMHATRCRLKIKPIEPEWGTASAERFEALCGEEPITAEFIHHDDKTNYVNLFTKGQSISELLIAEKLAVRDEALPEATDVVGFVSHLNSPSEFWIQLENCIDELEWVAEQLAAAANFKELNDLAPGTLCAALFPDDQMWYRARILSNTVAGIEVLFVDYGNSCTSCSLRELPEDLVMMAPLAQKCSLEKPDGLSGWGPEMVRKFVEISADGQTTFTVKKNKTGETSLVELLLNGVDVVSQIMPATERVKVKMADDLNELVLIKNGEEGKYELESLPDLKWNEESVRKFREIIAEGDTLEAEFVSESVVRLYRGLNDVRLSLSGAKTPVSSPAKMRREDSQHSNVESESKSDVESIVNEIINSSVDLNCKLLVDTVNESCTKDEIKEIVVSTIDEIVTKVTSNGVSDSDCDEIRINPEECLSQIDSGVEDEKNATP